MAIDLSSTTTDDRNERLLAWARKHGEFRGGDAAKMLGIKTQGIGPVLTSMVRSGDLVMNYHGSKRYYMVDAEQADEQDDILHIEDFEKPGFEDRLKDELNEHLGILNNEVAQIDVRRAQITQDIARVKAGIKKLA